MVHRYCGYISIQGGPQRAEKAGNQVYRHDSKSAHLRPNSSASRRSGSIKQEQYSYEDIPSHLRPSERLDEPLQSIAASLPIIRRDRRILAGGEAREAPGPDHKGVQH